MAKGIGPFVILGGAAALVALSMKKASGAGVPSEMDSDGVPKINADQVGFSLNFENYKVGSSWKIKVLDKYLDDARKAGDLAVVNWKTMKKEAASYPWLVEMTEKFGWDWDKPNNKGLAETIAFDRLLLQTRLDVLKKFFDSHYAAVPGSAITLSKLPKTAATDEFFENVLAYAGDFQKRDFTGI